MASKFLSRKFIVTLLVVGLGVASPIAYQKAGIGEGIILAVLALLSGVGVAYGVINMKDAKLDKRSDEDKSA